jgi:hypothetical protein
MLPDDPLLPVLATWESIVLNRARLHWCHMENLSRSAQTMRDSGQFQGGESGATYQPLLP